MSEHKSSAMARRMNDTGTVEAGLRVLHIVAAANEELARALGESAFLQAVCEAAVKKGGYLRAWIGLAEYDEDKAVRPVAQYGYEEGYLDSTSITWADTERGQDPAGRAIRTSRTQVNQNVLTNPLLVSSRKAALEQGFQASIGLPLKRYHGAFGAFTICAREPDAFGEVEVALLEGLAADLAFGIVALRTRAERERMVAKDTGAQ